MEICANILAAHLEPCAFVLREYVSVQPSARSLNLESVSVTRNGWQHRPTTQGQRLALGQANAPHDFGWTGLNEGYKHGAQIGPHALRHHKRLGCCFGNGHAKQVIAQQARLFDRAAMGAVEMFDKIVELADQLSRARRAIQERVVSGTIGLTSCRSDSVV